MANLGYNMPKWIRTRDFWVISYKYILGDMSNVKNGPFDELKLRWSNEHMQQKYFPDYIVELTHVKPCPQKSCVFPKLWGCPRTKRL